MPTAMKTAAHLLLFLAAIVVFYLGLGVGLAGESPLGHGPLGCCRRPHRRELALAGQEALVVLADLARLPTAAGLPRDEFPRRLTPLPSLHRIRPSLQPGGSPCTLSQEVLRFGNGRNREAVERLHWIHSLMQPQPCFVCAQVCAYLGNSSRHLILRMWEDKASFEAFRATPEGSGYSRNRPEGIYEAQPCGREWELSAETLGPARRQLAHARRVRHRGGPLERLPHPAQDAGRDAPLLRRARRRTAVQAARRRETRPSCSSARPAARTT